MDKYPMLNFILLVCMLVSYVFTVIGFVYFRVRGIDKMKTDIDGVSTRVTTLEKDFDNHLEHASPHITCLADRTALNNLAQRIDILSTNQVALGELIERNQKTLSDAMAINHRSLGDRIDRILERGK